jgi:hypothetical protein
MSSGGLELLTLSLARTLFLFFLAVEINKLETK